MKTVTKKLIELREKLSNANTWHCDKIQEILGEKEKNNMDINLDIRMKVHNQSHSILVATIKDIEQIMREDDPEGYNEYYVGVLNSSNESKSDVVVVEPADNPSGDKGTLDEEGKSK